MPHLFLKCSKETALPTDGEFCHEFRRQGFQLDGDDLDAAREIVVGDKVWDGHAKADDGAIQRLGNTVGHHLRISMIAEIAENADQSREGAEQSEQGGNTRGDFQKDETGFQA